MGGEQFYRSLHGFNVQSPFPLDGVVLPEPPGNVDIEIRIVDNLAAPPPSSKEILAYDDDGASVSAVTTPDGAVHVWFSGQGRFKISSRRDLVELWIPDSDALGMAKVLLQGWIMAMTLILRGCVVVHAAAVEFDNECVAILADSGMGKSTIAAMLLRDGGLLVSDDVLRITPPDPGHDARWTAHPGITALRLRAAAAELAAVIPGAELDNTPDGRTLVRPLRNREAPVPLRAVLIPQPSPEATELEINWLTPVQAAIELDQYPRVYDWKINGPIKNQFEAMAALSAEVPVGLMTVPWGPPWPPNLYGPLSTMLPSARETDLG